MDLDRVCVNKEKTLVLKKISKEEPLFEPKGIALYKREAEQDYLVALEGKVNTNARQVGRRHTHTHRQTHTDKHTDRDTHRKTYT